MNSLSVFDVFPKNRQFIKVLCRHRGCEHNDDYVCNLKRITINIDGICGQMLLKFTAKLEHLGVDKTVASIIERKCVEVAAIEGVRTTLVQCCARGFFYRDDIRRVIEEVPHVFVKPKEVIDLARDRRLTWTEFIARIDQKDG